jgi:hypothetical protein
VIEAINLSYLYHDLDVIEVRIVAQNAEFKASADVENGKLIEVATLIEGFPTSSQDTREVVLGAFGNNFAGGAAELQFFCKDSAGHSTIRVTIESDERSLRAPTPKQIEKPECAVLYIDFEPAELDIFVAQLKQVERTLKGSAILNINII